jgi:hypothetical protein
MRIDKSTASIDLDDSFFSLGGDSVTAMKVTRRCRQANLQMLTQDLLAGRTIRGLAARILVRSLPSHPSDVDGENRTRTDPGLFKLLSVSEQDIDAVVPATPFQHQMYCASRTHPGRPYCATYLAQLTTNAPDAQVDVQKLSRAWQRVVNCHPILRTLFVINSRDDTLYQVVLREAQAHIEVRHVEDEAGAAGRLREDHDAFSQEVTSAAASTKPGLAHRLILSQTRSGALFLALSLSHLVTDTVALEHKLADLDMFYNDASPTKPGVAFATYASWFDSRTVRANNKAWQEQVLRGAQPCFLLHPPTRSPGNIPRRTEEMSLPFSIPSSQRQKLSDFCRVAQVTTSHFFQFCWALLLKLYTQQDAVCFGQLVAGRDAPVTNLEEIVGPVLSILPAYVDLTSTSSSVLELMQSFQKTSIEALAYQPCSLKAIEKLMDCPADRGLFNTMINIRQVHYQEKDLEHHLEQRSLKFRPVEKRDASEVSGCLKDVESK